MKDSTHLEGLSPGELVEVIRNRHHNQLLSFALGWCKGSRTPYYGVDDLLQEFYIKLLRKIEVVRPEYLEIGLPYLIGMLKNMLIDWDRKKKIPFLSMEDLQPMPSESTPDHLRSIDQDLEMKFLMAQIEKSLSEEDFKIVVLRIKGFSYKEIAEELKMKVGTVGTRIHRLRPILNELLLAGNP